MGTRVHYTDLLSATDGRLVSTSHMDGVYKVFDAVAGPGVTTLALTFLADPVKKRLREQHPWTARPEVADAITAAIADLRNGNNSMKDVMDRHVLPYAPSEFIEVEHMGEENVAALQGGCADHLGKLLKGKEVIVVVAP